MTCFTVQARGRKELAPGRRQLRKQVKHQDKAAITIEERDWPIGKQPPPLPLP